MSYYKGFGDFSKADLLKKAKFIDI